MKPIINGYPFLIENHPKGFGWVLLPYNGTIPVFSDEHFETDIEALQDAMDWTSRMKWEAGAV